MCGGQRFCTKTWHRLHRHLCSSGTYGVHSGLTTYLHILGLGDTPDGHQMAFLHDNLEEEVFMEQPEGIKEPSKEDWVCYMHKTLYRLMQAAHAWNLHLHCAMLEIGYVCISVDHCIYMHNTPRGSSIVAVHIDIMAAAASDKAEMARLKEDLSKLFYLFIYFNSTFIVC